MHCSRNSWDVRDDHGSDVYQPSGAPGKTPPCVSDLPMESGSHVHSHWIPLSRPRISFSPQRLPSADYAEHSFNRTNISSNSPSSSNATAIDAARRTIIEVYDLYQPGEVTDQDASLLAEMGFQLSSSFCLIDSLSLSIIVFLSDKIIKLHVDRFKYMVLADDILEGLRMMQVQILPGITGWIEFE